MAYLNGKEKPMAVSITRKLMVAAIENGWTPGKYLIDFLEYDARGEFRIPLFSGERKADCALVVGKDPEKPPTGEEPVVVSWRGMCRAFPRRAYALIYPE